MRHVLVGCVCFALVACATEAPEEPVGSAALAIKGGVPSQRKNVVGFAIATNQGIAGCTGSLIAPNLVLTAHHCVAPVPSEQVACGTAEFGAPYDPGSFYVSTEDTLTQSSAFVGVREVVVPPGGNDVCGFDVAMLILDQPFAETPLVPRLDSEPVPDEGYLAVGYGATDDQGSGAFQRRERGSLFVKCIGASCGISQIKASEWLGDQGICSGDSGGPALDADERVIGVVSRGGPGCTTPIYGDVAVWADWIRETALHAAEEGGYAPPPWAGGESPETGGASAVGGAGPGGAGAVADGGAGGAAVDGPNGDDAEDASAEDATDDGCAVGPGAGAGRASIGAGLISALALALRRRRQRGSAR